MPVATDGQEATFTMMTVPKKQRLVAVDHIARIVDIQRHRRTRGSIAGAMDADHRPRHVRWLARGRRILGSAPCRLAGKPYARIVTQLVKVVRIPRSRRRSRGCAPETCRAACGFPLPVTAVPKAELRRLTLADHRQTLM